MHRSLLAYRLLGAFALAALLFTALPAEAQIDARMLRFPDVSETHISFVYAGDIWIVPKEGGIARRLSTPTGEEQFPRFSPDGQYIAYSANYDGNIDVYAVPAFGGQVRRVTHHPMGDRMLDWVPTTTSSDGAAILYASGMTSEKNRFSKLFTVPMNGGLPTQLPVPYGEFGTISPDGNTLAYMPISRDFRTWKRYRGGMAPEIWLFDLNDYSATNISQSDANDGHPMFHGSTLYFMSDRDELKRNNIWAYNTATGDSRQVTNFTDFDVRFPAIGPEEIVFEAGGRLYLLDLDTEQTREVQVEVVTDRSTLKPRTENVAGLIASADISPSGKRVMFEARGDIFSVPAENGVTRNLTRTSGVAERSPEWSPDGAWVAYFSDASGEYELVLRASDGSGDERTVTALGEGFRYTPYWSPDSTKLAFIDQAMVIRVYDVDADTITEVDQSTVWMGHGGVANFRPSWSHDSRWLAYSFAIANQHNAVFLFDTDSGERHQVTSGFYGERSPAFDPEGRYLYVLTSRSLSPSYSNFDNSFIYANSTQVAAISLRNDVPSPLAPRNDEEPMPEGDDDAGDSDSEGDSDSDADGDMGADEDAEASDDSADDDGLQIGLEGFESRLVLLPPQAGNYNSLQATSNGPVYVRNPRTGSGGGGSHLMMWNLDDREEATILENVGGYDLSADGCKALVVSRGRFGVINVRAGARIDPAVDTSNLELVVDPPAEWRQIYNDVFRLFRDYFYVANMHGVDWESLGERYSALLNDVVTRWDLSFVINELIAELNAGHAYNRGAGDVERAETRNVGLLGADYEVDQGHYRIARIIEGAPWDASEVRSPLAAPGLGVSAGDYILAVNGVPMETSRDPWSYFQGMARETVELTVNSAPTTDGSRSVLVDTLASEGRLRNLAWIDANRRRVLEATDGRVGYVYVPDTGQGGQTELMRQWAAQIHMEGLVIDERFNSGGQIPDRFVEKLNRPLYSYWGVRDGNSWQWPPVSHPGPKVMLINGWSGSGGDAFPYFFREAGIGPLIGTRTWGGLIGISGVPGLIDGGAVSVPTFGIYDLAGNWIIEGYGVDPDIEVIDDPSQLAQGTDPQLEAAIAEVMRLMEANPFTRTPKPADPDRSDQ
ncbi:MAG: peptidase S41 [Acidobacteria bacterium]|nr:peptidase S41 [Acidobacteriota bacterium]